MLNRKAVLRWLKATLVLSGLPLTTATIGSSLPGVPINWGGNELIVLDSKEFRSEVPKARKRDRKRFAAGVRAILNEDKRPQRAFKKLRKRWNKSACVANNLAIAYLISEDYDGAEAMLVHLKRLRSQCQSNGMRRVLDRNCVTLSYLLST